MADSDQAVERLAQADGGAVVDSPGFDRRSFLRRTALSGVAAGSVGTLLASNKAKGATPCRTSRRSPQSVTLRRRKSP